MRTRLLIALPALASALVPAHPYSRSRSRGPDIRWTGVRCVADGGEPKDQKRVDELLNALSKADGGQEEAEREEKEPSGFSMAMVSKEWELLQQGEGVRSTPICSVRASTARNTGRGVLGARRRRTSFWPSSCPRSPSSSPSGSSSLSRATFRRSRCTRRLRSMTSSPSRR